MKISDEIGGSKKYIQWLETYDEKTNNPSYSLKSVYECHLLIIEFDNIRINYGVLFGDYNDPEYISFGQTYVSTDGEYRKYFEKTSEIQKIYDQYMQQFHNIEKIIQRMLFKHLIELLSINTVDGRIDITFYNIMILALIINLSTKDVINNKYDNHVDPKFINLINYIYDFDSSVLTDPFIQYQHLGSKIIPINNFEDNNEVFINKIVNEHIIKYGALMFSPFIDWAIIQPITPNFFNNTLLKDIKNNTGILLVNMYIGNSLNTSSHSTIEPCNIFELMYGLYALHVNNIVHGDICLANLTIQETVVKNSVNVYILSEYGEIDTYVFNTTKYRYHIIDFSKSTYVTENNYQMQYLTDYLDLSNCLLSIYQDNEILQSLNTLVKKMINQNEKIELSIFKKLFSLYLFTNDDIEFHINNISYIK